MKALTLHNPWAVLMAKGLKEFETRSWGTKHRGPLAIHAARMTAQQREHIVEFAPLLKLAGVPTSPLASGGIVAIGELVDCWQMTPERIAAQSELELQLGNWQPGRWAWVFHVKHDLSASPIVMRGYQGLWDVEIEGYEVT